MVNKLALIKKIKEEDEAKEDEAKGIKRKLHDALEKGGMLGPDLKKPSNYKNCGRKPKGKRTGVAIGLKSNRRELGAPVLRRDPTAQAKLKMIQDLQFRCNHGD